MSHKSIAHGAVKRKMTFLSFDARINLSYSNTVYSKNIYLVRSKNGNELFALGGT